MGAAGWFYVGTFILGAGLFCFYAKIGKLLRCIFFTALTGLLTLGAVLVLGHWLQIPLQLTPLSCLVSALLGVPGVVTMLALHLL